MGRPREYDEDEVLERAMLLFWAQGYEATSMRQLLGATGLAKGSLYQGFGGKQQLFDRALARYLERGRDDLRRCLRDGATAYLGLREWLLENARPSAPEGLRRGCMAVNTAVELAPHHPDTRRVLRAHEQQMERLYRTTIERGREDGSLVAALDPAATARWLTTTIYGLQVRAKLGMSHAQGRETVDQALALLTPP